MAGCQGQCGVLALALFEALGAFLRDRWLGCWCTCWLKNWLLLEQCKNRSASCASHSTFCACHKQGLPASLDQHLPNGVAKPACSSTCFPELLVKGKGCDMPMNFRLNSVIMCKHGAFSSCEQACSPHRHGACSAAVRITETSATAVSHVLANTEEDAKTASCARCRSKTLLKSSTHPDLLAVNDLSSASKKTLQ